jgi:hypothetical protein
MATEPKGIRPEVYSTGASGRAGRLRTHESAVFCELNGDHVPFSVAKLSVRLYLHR